VLASFTSNGILNLECAVRPLGKSRDATPEEATASTIFFSERNYAIIVFHRKVLHVPPWSQTKKNPSELL
jgi:hypothetical protein